MNGSWCGGESTELKNREMKICLLAFLLTHGVRINQSLTVLVSVYSFV